jgi:hypothetical protein
MSVGHGFVERWGNRESIPPKTYTGHGAFTDVSMVAVTLLRGREQPGIAESFRTDQDYSNYALDQQEDEIEQELAIYGGSMIRRRGCDLFDHMRNIPEFDRIRLSRLMRVLRCDVSEWESLIKPALSLKRSESYVSSNGQTMLWSVWFVLSPAETVTSAMRLNVRRKAAGLLEYGPGMFR